MKSLSKADSAALADPVSTLTRRVQGQLSGRLKAWLKDRYIKRVHCQGKFRLQRFASISCVNGYDPSSHGPAVQAGREPAGLGLCGAPGGSAPAASRSLGPASGGTLAGAA